MVSEGTPPAAEATSSPTQAQEEPAPLKYYGTPTALHNIALIAAIVGPIGLLLPGRGRRTFSIQNAIIGSGSFFGINQLAYDFTGKSVVQRSNERWRRLLTPLDPLPQKAKERKALMEAERARRAGTLPPAAAEEERRKMEEKESAQRGVVERIWMGNEKAGWQERRRDEDRKALDSGKGVGDIIMDQIWEVWGKKGEDGKNDDATEASKKEEPGPENTKKP